MIVADFNHHRQSVRLREGRSQGHHSVRADGDGVVCDDGIGITRAGITAFNDNRAQCDTAADERAPQTGVAREQRRRRARFHLQSHRRRLRHGESRHAPAHRHRQRQLRRRLMQCYLSVFRHRQKVVGGIKRRVDNVKARV